jgi:hypothetical protein
MEDTGRQGGLNASVRVNTSLKMCFAEPAPLEAITGMETAGARPRSIPGRSRVGAVAIDTVQQDLTGAEGLAGPGQGLTASTSRPSRPPLMVHWNQQ